MHKSNESLQNIHTIPNTNKTIEKINKYGSYDVISDFDTEQFTSLFFLFRYKNMHE